MKRQVVEAIQNARANLDQAISDLEKIPEVDAATTTFYVRLPIFKE